MRNLSARARAIRLLAVENKLVTEGAGAISLAAALATPKNIRGKSVCILSGGSIDAGKLAQYWRRSEPSMATAKRLVDEPKASL